MRTICCLRGVVGAFKSRYKKAILAVMFNAEFTYSIVLHSTEFQLMPLRPHLNFKFALPPTRLAHLYLKSNHSLSLNVCVSNRYNEMLVGLPFVQVNRSIKCSLKCNMLFRSFHWFLFIQYQYIRILIIIIPYILMVKLNSVNPIYH